MDEAPACRSCEQGATANRCQGRSVRRLGKPWDKEFATWIENAKGSGRDPNNIGDEEWLRDPLAEAIERHYLPLVHPSATVLELGPGTGRLTRHVIGACRRMILVDYSALVCSWLKTYLKGRGEFQVLQIEKPQLSGIEDASIDAVMSNGVFEHLDMDEIFDFLREFHRVLRPEAVVHLTSTTSQAKNRWLYSLISAQVWEVSVFSSSTIPTPFAGSLNSLALVCSACQQERVDSHKLI